MEPPLSMAFAATLGEEAGERFVTIGRWHVSAGGEAAEIAFTVEDIYQHQGIGTAMVKCLAEAAKGYGIKRLTASVLLENSLML
ncbi:MAG: GNAT family N-acetyltransferase [Dehalococcoidia bacterium]|jgi:GNAT superfamily N-acetyltransferase|nr:GNAT family N-acetyltransferase [Dehalococcoidia bacterium]